MLIAVVGLVLLALVVGTHWYVWRRPVRDTTAPRTALRRAGTAVVVLGPALAVAALVSERTGAPFLLVQALSWPGYLWLAVFLYLLLAQLAGELVRPLLRRVLARRERPAREEALEADLHLGATPGRGFAQRVVDTVNGTGAWGPPVRVGAPADVTVIRLASG